MNRKGAGAQYEYESDDDDDEEEPEWRGGRCRIHHAGRERSNEPNGWEKGRASRWMDGRYRVYQVTEDGGQDSR